MGTGTFALVDRFDFALWCVKAIALTKDTETVIVTSYMPPSSRTGE